MIGKEQIAHDLAVAWTQSAIEKKVVSLTGNRSMVEEYLAAYDQAIQKLEQLRAGE